MCPWLFIGWIHASKEESFFFQLGSAILAGLESFPCWSSNSFGSFCLLIFSKSNKEQCWLKAEFQPAKTHLLILLVYLWSFLIFYEGLDVFCGALHSGLSLILNFVSEDFRKPLLSEVPYTYISAFVPCESSVISMFLEEKGDHAIEILQASTSHLECWQIV